VSVGGRPAIPVAVQREFWVAVRSGMVVAEAASCAGGPLYFMKVPEPKVGKNRLHLDLVTSGPMEAEVTRLVEAGAKMVEVRQDPASYDNPDTWTVMRDPEGNEFCVTSTATVTGWA
jgi:Glyoxalase-like domain